MVGSALPFDVDADIHLVVFGWKGTRTIIVSQYQVIILTDKIRDHETA